jgi:hypothetical protein
MIVPARRRAPRTQNYRGLGATVPIYENCNPLDSACVARNTAAQGAYELQKLAEENAGHLQWCLTGSGYPAADCYATYGPQGSIAQHANAGQAVQLPVLQPVLSAPVAPAAPLMSQAPLPVNGDTLASLPSANIPPFVLPKVSSSATLQAPGTDIAPASTTSPASGFDLSTIPWYVWAGGAVAALYFIGGQSGR